MKLDKFFVGIMVFIVVIVSGSLVLTQFSDSYDDVELVDSRISNLTSDVTDLSNDINGTAQTINEGIFNKFADTFRSTLDFAGFMFSGAFSALKTLMSVPEAVYTLLNTVGTEMGIPSIIISIITTMMMLAIMIAMILLIMRLNA